MLNPESTMLVLKHNGKEVGRIAATASNANDYTTEMARHYKDLQIDYEENKDAAMISRLLSRPR